MNKDYTYIIIGACMMATLAACSGDNTDEQTPQADGSISFEAEAPLFTRSLIDTDAKLQSAGFGVFAYYTEDNLWEDASSPIPDFMYNQKVEWSTDHWTYSPVKYWPNDDTKKYVSFFAYAPYSSAYSATTAVNASNQPLISYTWENTVDPSSQADLLYASQKDCYKTMAEGYGTVTGRVPFHFQHALAAIEFKVRRKEASGDQILLQSLSLNASADATAASSSQATLNTSGTFNLGTSAWASFTTGNPTFTYSGTALNTALTASGTGVTAYTNEDAHALTSYTPNLLLIMPQESTVTIPFTLSYTLGGTVKSPSGTITFTQPTGGWAIEMGRKYTVVFIIDGGEVESYLLRAKEAEQW